VECSRNGPFSRKEKIKRGEKDGTLQYLHRIASTAGLKNEKKTGEKEKRKKDYGNAAIFLSF